MAMTLEARPPLSSPSEKPIIDSLTLVEDFILAGVSANSYALNGPLAHSPNGVYVDPEQADASGELPAIESIDILPEGLELGAGDSHHGVLFCEILVIENDGNSKHVRVAIKPFDTKGEHARREYDNLVAANRRGFDTFEPLALAKHGDTSFLITRRRPDINSLDNMAWDTSPFDEETYASEVLPSLNLMATTLAKMHASGFFHGDAQAKNFALTDTGNTHIGDLEDAVITHDPNEVIGYINGFDGDPAESLAYADMTHCWYALIHPINPDSPNVFLENESSEVCMEIFERDFLNPYIVALQTMTHPSLIDKMDIDGLRAAIYGYIARTT